MLYLNQCIWKAMVCLLPNVRNEDALSESMHGESHALSFSPTSETGLTKIR
jgi:hypothetical protein